MLAAKKLKPPGGGQGVRVQLRDCFPGLNDSPPIRLDESLRLRAGWYDCRFGSLMSHCKITLACGEGCVNRGVVENLVGRKGVEPFRNCLKNSSPSR